MELTFLKELMLIEISALKRCDIYYYLYFLNCSFEFQLNVCNKC